MSPFLSPTRQLLLSGIAPWLCVAIGAVLLYRGSQDLTLAEKTADWARTGGRVMASSVEQAPQAKDGTTYRALILYEYRVGPAVLHGTRREFTDQPFRSEADARAIVTRYPVGLDVTVFYNPFLPNEAVLELGSPWWPYGVLGAGGVFILVGLSLSVLMARRGRMTRLAQQRRKGPPA
jgi:hypothetical protein